MNLSVNEIAKAVNGRILCGNEWLKVKNISLNSRIMKGGDLFVPVIGERVDAHNFILQAWENGAVCAFTSRHKNAEEAGICGKDFSLIAVGDTVAALQALGAYYRERYVKIPLVGVTGSVGKTTTREMAAAAFSAGFKVYATKGNSNSQVGVPITITETDEDAQIGVIELGMSEFGEMTKISNVAKPDAAIITNIGISHINQLKTRENILIQKLHILDGMRDGGTLVLNGDDEYLRELDLEKIRSYGIAKDKNIRLLFYGTGENADFTAHDIETFEGYPEFTVTDRDTGESARMRLSVPGEHMILNSAACAAAASVFGIGVKRSLAALSAFSGVKGRGEIYNVCGITIIDDSYNAAPASMKAGLKVLSDMPLIKRKIAVLADMLELGERESEYHREVGEYMADNDILPDAIFLLGRLSGNIGEGFSERLKERGLKADTRIRHFSDLSEMQACLERFLKDGDTVLFKGSNSMGLSKIVRSLTEKE